MGCELVPSESLGSALKDRDLAESRYLVGGLAIESWRLRAGELAAALGKRPEAIIRWAARAGKRQQADEASRRRYETLDEMLYLPNRRKRRHERSS